MAAGAHAGTTSHLERHLDLGCGGKPRNPYGRARLFGVDLAPAATTAAEIRGANLALEPIPFPDDHFASVSAYDFLEHVPRILPTADGKGTRFPFVELMNEIWRVLAPDGLFYGHTPAYPHESAFQDPTHVNILTERSAMYFTVPDLLAGIYGFRGAFELVRQMRVRTEFDYEPVAPDWRRRYRLRRHIRRGEASHLVWEFKALKRG